jgi:flagellar basal body P-ring protein FlgI
MLAWCAALVLPGCTSWNLFPTHKAETALETAVEEPKLVGDLAVPFGLFPVRVEYVALVKGLHGAGSDPEPSPTRSIMMEEMKRRGVPNPNQWLASKDVSLVLVRGVMPPGTQKGDRFDVEVRVPPRSETTSLRGGYLLETRLSDMAVKDGRLFDGKVRAIAEGPVLVDPTANGKSEVGLLCHGRILGGGVARESRSLGLFLPGAEETKMSPEQLHNAAVKSAQVQNAINRRLHVFKNGIQTGVARAVRGNYVDLLVLPRYKDNLDRYVQVIRAIPMRETPLESKMRIEDLQKKLLDPAQSALAAIKLEAIGRPASEALIVGAKSNDPEVRFYAGEALAYLDQREAAEPLAEAARNVPAFRSRALTALSVMDDFAAYEQVRDLLGLPSAETRYGAFRALTIMRPDDGLVKGENLGGQFNYHVLDTQGPAMVHVTTNHHAEVVLFGQRQQIRPPFALNAGNLIMVTSVNDTEVAVSKFAPQEADQKRTVSTRLDDIIRAVVELGGTYPDVVQMLQEAKGINALEGRFEVDAVPAAGRTYDPSAATTESSDDDGDAGKDAKIDPFERSAEKDKKDGKDDVDDTKKDKSAKTDESDKDSGETGKKSSAWGWLWPW